MKIITVYTPKGGTGRTATVMALAAGFWDRGMRVLVVDATEHAFYKRSFLKEWERRMLGQGVRPDQLEVVTHDTAKGLEDTLAATQADVVLVDTMKVIDPAQRAAIKSADLILCPVTGPMEASMTAGWLTEHTLTHHAMGLVIQSPHGPVFTAQTRTAFGDTPVMQSEMPWSPIFQDPFAFGNLGQVVRELFCAPGKKGYGHFREVQAVYGAVQMVASEVLFALQGQRLIPETAQVTTPDMSAFVAGSDTVL